VTGLPAELDTSAEHDAVLAATKQWLETAVIGLNLCPFARAVHVRERIRYRLCFDASTSELAGVLAAELQLLRDADAKQHETTLIIHPHVLQAFVDYNEFLNDADAIVDELGLEGIVQVASFHPQYQFAGTAPDDIENYTNRSPYAMLHLLRESSVEAAVADHPGIDRIAENNIKVMNDLGIAGWRRLWN
jgi:hypothetical protein